MVKRDLITTILLLVLAFLLAICLRVFVFEPHQITKSQANSYLKTQDYVLATKLKKPNYKDFVLYEVDGKEYLGRVIAKEGDVPVFMDDIFYLNNKVENQTYLDSVRQAHTHSAHMDSPFTADFTLSSLTGTSMAVIPQHQYLILNDNRQDTMDSRQFGLIKETQLRGVVSFKVLPLEDFGFVDTE